MEEDRNTSVANSRNNPIQTTAYSEVVRLISPDFDGGSCA